MFGGGGEKEGVGGRISSGLGAGAGGGQWGPEETRELILIRGELERDFTAAKRNKTLWEIVNARMKNTGYIRTPDQCKCKWKNLLNRYKGKETSYPENGRQFPFFEELHAVFTERAKNLQRLLLESEAGSVQAKKKMKRISTDRDRSSDEFSEDEEDDDEDESEEERQNAKSISRKRKAETIGLDKSPRPNSATSITLTNAGLQEMLREFFQQQQRMEMQWREIMERRARERQLFEQEWRQSMEKLERERLMAERAWREREEQRRLREESRAERRDALLTTLLNKLINDNTL
ncbi:trihelix transcription factor GT-3b-like protein [Corchorus capsularis]|uniref:Trihelix transcription factor GT-3b-like protein n=1 Tax=Corchorus capsularis TaxID=210143 RepID=A0A1R3JIM2_COCAP|nr:trihelix transcription factor GT-3b-like protein [Corchorus capsularis]